MSAHIAAMAARLPDAPAVFAPRRDRAGQLHYDQLTFRELNADCDRLAIGFERIGIRRGVRTALMVPPSLDFFALTFALFRVGAVPVLIDPGIGLKNFGKCLAEAEPTGFIGIPKAHAARVLLGWSRKTISIPVTVGAKWFWGGHTLADVRRTGMESPLPVTESERRASLGTTTDGSPIGRAMLGAPKDTAAILFTSGSTGVPKGVLYTHAMFAAQIDQLRQLYGIQPGEIDLPTFPLFALFGPALGMAEVLPEMDFTRPAQADPVKLVAAIKRFRVTNMFGSPALINRLGRHGEAHGVKLPTLRRAISAGAPVPAKTLARFAALLPPGAQVFTPYGATECLPVANIGSAEILGETREQTEMGKGVCVGQPVAGLTAKIIRITDDPIAAWSDDLELPPGEIGEIAVQAPQASRAYFNREQSTVLAKIPTADGGFFHRMGDLGYRDERGRLWFCGRKSHRVVTRNGTLFTIPCEAIFNTHPAVFRSALVGVPQGDDMEPVLCVELEAAERDRSELGKLELRSELLHLGAQFPHTQAIRRIMFHPSFPVDIRHNAKIFREKLAIWAAARH
ncbi:MAG: peptide synthase [Verrucomicrobia bacterium]|nr:peptide synthase [Verrucomicrobiota bacterium]NBU08676.1 peptide synthase [Pseudomonadota bacterium]NDB76989.1 peptide synthase [Verrucomicrobiota bacterium]